MENTFRFIIYGQTDTEEENRKPLAGTNDLEDAKEILERYFLETEKLFDKDGLEIVTFGLFDTQINDNVYLN